MTHRPWLAIPVSLIWMVLTFVVIWLVGYLFTSLYDGLFGRKHKKKGPPWIP